MQDRFSAPAQSDVRAPRVPVNYPAVITTADGRERSVTVLDVSAEGFRVEGQDGLSCGEQIYLRVGKGPNLAAEIRWVGGTTAGGVFFDLPEV